MVRPLIPPDYVNVKVNILLSGRIPPTAFHTYCQLKALAWTNDGEETPPFTFEIFKRLTGKPQATLYGHLALLRDCHVLRYVNTGEGHIVVTFTEADHGDDSRNLESLVSDLSLSLNDLNGGDMDKSVPIYGNSEHSEAYRKRSEEALFRGIAAHAGLPEGLEEYPEDCRMILAEVCKLWMLLPPRKSGRTASPYAYWITGARDLIDAAGELGIEALRAEREDFVAYMQKHQGLAPYRVEGPSSLIKSVRAKAGELRQRQALVHVAEPPPAAVEW